MNLGYQAHKGMGNLCEGTGDCVLVWFWTLEMQEMGTQGQLHMTTGRSN